MNFLEFVDSAKSFSVGSIHSVVATSRADDVFLRIEFVQPRGSTSISNHISETFSPLILKFSLVGHGEYSIFFIYNLQKLSKRGGVGTFR